MEMKLRKINYVSASIVILLTALFRVLLLILSFYSWVVFNQEASAEEKLPLSNVLNFESLFPPVVLLAEAALYIVLRKRLFQRRLVRLHVWITILSSVFFPIAQIIIVDIILRQTYAPVELAQYDRYVLFFGWAMFAAARLFFILAVRKSVTSPKESLQSNESPGFLDDFAK